MLWPFNWYIQILFGNILWNVVIMNKVGEFVKDMQIELLLYIWPLGLLENGEEISWGLSSHLQLMRSLIYLQ
jgi:hypothetical protein